MISPANESEFQQTKKEESTPYGTSKYGNSKTILSSSRQWSAFRNPRIVRVSRSFGGKDRHSKVCTVRGLRDRRIRLSVPTAIQLYDLQERLGLSQPSKVIDWLMDSTKDDIEKLPPLQLPQGSFGQFLQQSIIGGISSSHNDQTANPNTNLPLFFDGNSALFSRKDTGININNNNDFLQDVGDQRSKYWDYLDAASKTKSKEVERDNELNNDEKIRWMEMNNQHAGLNHFQGLRGYNNNSNQVLAQNFFPVASDSPYNPYNQNWDQLENRGITSSTHQPRNDHNNTSLLSASSSSTFGSLNPSGGQQLIFCPPSTSTFFPVTTTTYPPYSTMSLEASADPRHINSHFHLFSPSSSIKTFQLNNENPNKLLQSSHSQDEDDSSS